MTSANLNTSPSGSRNRLGIVYALVIAFVISSRLATAAEFDHVHLNVTDPAAAARWYAKNLGGQSPSDDSVNFGRVTLRFRKVAEAAEGSVGSAIDHLGFAYPDIVAKMRELAASDVEIVSGIEVEGPIKYAFVRDRWNTLLEIVEDAEVTGFHHIHIATTDPRAALAWYQDSLAGQRGRFAGVLPGIRFRDGWVLAKGADKPRAPTKGRSIDHVSWSAASADRLVETLQKRGARVERETDDGDQAPDLFLAAPDGARIELVEGR